MHGGTLTYHLFSFSAVNASLCSHRFSYFAFTSDLIARIHIGSHSIATHHKQTLSHSCASASIYFPIASKALMTLVPTSSLIHLDALMQFDRIICFELRQNLALNFWTNRKRRPHRLHCGLLSTVRKLHTLCRSSGPSHRHTTRCSSWLAHWYQTIMSCWKLSSCSLLRHAAQRSGALGMTSCLLTSSGLERLEMAYLTHTPTRIRCIEPLLL